MGTTLKSFLDEYLKDEAKKNAKKSYAEWLVDRGSTAKDDYISAAASARIDAMRSKPSYGAMGESLASRGLSDSGYAAYLEKKKENRAAEINEALRKDYSIATAEQKGEYFDYSKQYDENADRLGSSVIEALKKSKTLSYEDAYLYAVNLGLSKENAAAAAKSGVEAARNIVKGEVVDKIISKRLTYDETKSLATGLGLEEEDAKRLGEFAKLYSGYWRKGDKNYSEYLRKKLKELQQEKKKSD